MALVPSVRGVLERVRTTKPRALNATSANKLDIFQAVIDYT